MPTPKKKVSRSRRNMRRAHHALSAINLSSCSNCSAPRLSHSVCESCGFYKGRFVAKNILKSDLLAVLR
ncbi:50S ribosomal protein L32 [Spirobacillus cienkowskii]|jgi:large subunit ribosomal protein L32|uniref:Large ribosomal subunit protein bL32 n=1 Tax=Spirobacillus cienkowskii TaxID=495820 RepID=A0A369KQT0_9BACT|nr:MAG: 50S ribosomal protein L32 [Spirobacillus cienkowskii]